MVYYGNIADMDIFTNIDNKTIKTITNKGTTRYLASLWVTLEGTEEFDVSVQLSGKFMFQNVKLTHCPFRNHWKWKSNI